jgi:hypothetical protein
MSCFGGFRRISGLKNWEFGFRLKHILVSATCLKSVSTKKSLNWIGKSQLRTYNNLLNLQAYPFSGVRHLRRLAPGSGGPPAASVGQLRRCLLSQPAGCLRLKTAETLDVWQSKVYSYNILYQWISHNVSSCHNSIDSRFCGFGVPELGSFDY